MAYPCPQCGVRKGQAHKNWCKRAQRRRQPGFGRLPRRQQAKYEAHRHVARVYKTVKGTEYLRCKVCDKKMGSRKKGQ